MKTLLLTVFLILIPTVASADTIRQGYLQPQEVDQCTLVLDADEKTDIIVSGSGNADIDCWLYDDLGHLVSVDVDDTSICLLDVTPVRRGRFFLHIKNQASYTRTTYTAVVR